MTEEQAKAKLLEIAQAYLDINSDDGILEPQEKADIEEAIKVFSN